MLWKLPGSRQLFFFFAQGVQVLDRSLAAGILATCMTGAVVGMIGG